MPPRQPAGHMPGVLLALLSLLWAAGTCQARPVVPTHDAEVIERLPPAARTSNSADPAVAVAEARALLAASRRDGDPRFAGRALARLARWQAQPLAPGDVVLALAETEQYLHQFDAATGRLQTLVQRAPDNASAWLLLATLHRVQGRYAQSDAACTSLQQLRAQPYGEACAIENQSLRGDHAAARVRLQRLLAGTTAPATRAWLLTTLAELEQRAGQVAAADTAWQQSLRAETDGYALTGYADFLLDQQRDQAAWDLLRGAAASEGVLLRRAIAAKRLGRPEAEPLRREIRERYAQADLRPEDSGHQRERALRALDIEGQPVSALGHARRNLVLQREPFDLWLFARCAQAARDPAALAEVRRLAQQQGLRDARLDSL